MGNCRSEREAGGRSCQLLLFDTRLLNRTEQTEGPGSRLCRLGKGGEPQAAFSVPLRSPALGLSVALFGEGVANLEALVTFPSSVC